MKQKLWILTAVIGLLVCGTACRENEVEKVKTKTTETVQKVPEVKPEVVYASEIPLFDKGQTSWQVVIPVNASEVNKYAAEEFVTAIKKIAGVEIPVVYADDLQPGNNIVIGALKDNPLVTRMAGFLNLGDVEDNDTIGVHTIAGNLYLVGNNPRSAVYAVYHFLREYLGARWFWPGADGEYMPKKDFFKVPEIAYHFQSPFRYRAASPVGNHGDGMIETATFRMFTNGERLNRKVADKTGAVRIIGNHSVGMFPREFEKYPECFAVMNGLHQKEGIAGCWSNPLFLELMVKKHADWVKREKADLICAFVMDVIQRCQCEECTKVKDKSARWYIFYSKMVNEIRKQCPELRAAALAYQEYSAIPEGVPLDGFEYVEYCLSNRCYIHPMDHPDCPLNKKALSIVRAWQEKSPMGIYGYEFAVFNRRMYLPIHNQLAKTAQFFSKNNIVRLKTEFPATRAWGKSREQAGYLSSRLSGYVFCLTSWNPDLDVNALVRDFCNYVYGAGAEAMYEYHTTMASYWDNMSGHTTYFLSPPDNISTRLLTHQRIRDMRAVLNRAEKAIAAMPDEAARKRAADDYAVDKYYFDQWEKTYYLAQNTSYTLNLPKCDAKTDFDILDKQPVSSENGTHSPTDVRMFWSADGLHFRVIGKNAGLDSMEKGPAGRDPDLSRSAHVAFYLDPNDGKPIRRFGVGLGGGIYDAMGEDTSWNPEWTASVRMDKENDQWTLEVILPFASITGKAPEKDTQWKINIIRSAAGKNKEVCGFPAPVYHNLDAGAILNFSERAKPGMTVAFLHPDAKNDSRAYRVGRNSLVKSGWQARSINGLENLKKADLTGIGLIFVKMYKFDLPVEVFHEKILPEVERGAVIYFNTYGWIHRLPQYFKDPTFKVDFKGSAAGVRSYTWITDTSFSKVPNKFTNSHSPPGVLYPAYPEKWEVLAKQKDGQNVERPCIICRPYGKGLVAISADLYYRELMFLDNIYEYNKVVPRDGGKQSPAGEKK